MTTISLTRARVDLSDIANRVKYGGERIVVAKNGKPAFALVSMEDVGALEALEDKRDIKAAKEARRRHKFTDLEKLAKELGV